MKLLITGGGGQIATALTHLLTTFPADQYRLLTKQDLNICDIKNVNQVIKTYRPNVVINLAAYTQVDKAEHDKELCFAVNAMGARNLALTCQTYQALFIHLSTDYIFAGEKNSPYSEVDSPSPCNVYGASKLQGEQWITKLMSNFIILRVSSVFSSFGHNFVKSILHLAREKTLLKIVSDQIAAPTPALEIAKIILLMCENPVPGIYHYCGTPAISWFEFAKQIVTEGHQHQSLKLQELMAIPACEYPTAAVRPIYSVLNCEKIKTTFNIQQPNWQRGLPDVIKALSTA